MNLTYMRWGLFVLLIFFLSAVPFPVGYENLRPFWGLFMILYAQFNGRFSYFLPIFLGLILDTLTLMPLGEHVFALSLTAGIAMPRARRFKFFSAFQQMIWICFLSFIYQSTLFTMDCIQGHSPHYLRLFIPVLVSTFTWPIFILCAEQLFSFEKSRSI